MPADRFRRPRPSFRARCQRSQAWILAGPGDLPVAGLVGLAWGLAASSAVTLIVLSSAAPRLRGREDSERRTSNCRAAQFHD